MARRARQPKPARQKGPILPWIALGLLLACLAVAALWAGWHARHAGPPPAAVLPLAAPIQAAPAPKSAPAPASPPPAPANKPAAASQAGGTPPAQPTPPVQPVQPPQPPQPPPEIALGPVPDPALVAKSPHGLLPVIGPDGREAWQVYARPFADLDKRPRIGILIADLGLSQATTKAAIQELPGAVTLGFVPYAGDLQSALAQARTAGHEAILELPMEPDDYPTDDPGPHALLTSLSVADNIDRLDWQLARVTGYIGVTNYMGSKFIATPDEIRPILEAVKSRGLMFLDGGGTQHSIAVRIARDAGLPYAVSNLSLDAKASGDGIDAALAALEKIARTSGAAVGIGHPYPVTLNHIAAWARTLPAKGLVLAPVSAIVNRQSEQK